MQGTDTATHIADALAPERADMALALVAHIYGVETKMLRVATRGNPRAALARQVAMYLCHVVHRMSLSAIGDAFGRNRSTAAHAVRHIEEMRDDPEVDRVLLQLEVMLRKSEKDAA